MGLHCLPMPHKKDARLIWVNQENQPFLPVRLTDMWMFPKTSSFDNCRCRSASQPIIMQTAFLVACESIIWYQVVQSNNW